ncbi:MAG: RlmI/RlmK family 23S rRNA methyltransferase, partial [Bacillus sp. (in: firmicutes)]
MNKEINLKVKTKFVNKLKSGYPLISKEAIINGDDQVKEGSIVRLVDEKNIFIAKGYYGKQNKGLGWVLSRQETISIDQRFFENKLKEAFKERESFYKS